MIVVDTSVWIDYFNGHGRPWAGKLDALLDVENAVRNAEHYRLLRERGITIRKTADVIIAPFSIVEGHSLLFTDRDFGPFVEHLGLRAVT